MKSETVVLMVEWKLYEHEEYKDDPAVNVLPVFYRGDITFFMERRSADKPCFIALGENRIRAAEDVDL
jgi:hypothetical protein